LLGPNILVLSPNYEVLRALLVGSAFVAHRGAVLFEYQIGTPSHIALLQQASSGGKMASSGPWLAKKRAMEQHNVPIASLPTN
jgi:hypothetical protein